MSKSTDNGTPPFAFGQWVYLVEASAHRQVEIPCPVCFGKLKVTLILGNGEREDVECEACGKGFRGPTGTVTRWEAFSAVRPAQVTSISLEDGEWKVRCGHWSCDELFATAEEAEERRKVLHAECSEHAQRMFEQNLKSKKKSHAWNVRYHRECIARLEREKEHHEKRLCRLKAERVEKKEQCRTAISDPLRD